MIDVTEVHDVATSDIPGAFLKNYHDKVDIHIKIEGWVVTLLEYIGLAYYKYFIYMNRRGRKLLYAEAQKAIYGTLEVSLFL